MTTRDPSTYGKNVINEPGQAPRYVDLTAEEIADLEALAAQTRTLEAERLAVRAARISKEAELRDYDYAQARAVIDAAELPAAVKDVFKDLLTHVSHLRSLISSR